MTAENTGCISFRERDESLDRSARGPFWLHELYAARLGDHAQSRSRGFGTAHTACQPSCAVEQVVTPTGGSGGPACPFWQDESYDHWIRSAQELEEITAYVEDNPVKPGLVAGKE